MNNPRFLRKKTTGEIFPWTRFLAEREDMEPYSPPETQKAPEPKPQKQPPWITQAKSSKLTAAPLPPPPPPPPAAPRPPTDAKEVMALFKPAVTATETEAQNP
jgi:hypothetical protein